MKGLTSYAKKISEVLPAPLFKLGCQLYWDRSFPRHLFIETTGRCNLACSYCTRKRPGFDMRFGVFKKIIDEARQHGKRSFSLHMFGEPLLWPHIGRGVEYIKRVNRRNSILLTTNGTLLHRFSNRFFWNLDMVIWTVRKGPESSVRRLGPAKVRVRFFEEIHQKQIKEWASWPNKEIRKMHNFAGTRQSNSTNSCSRYPCYHLWFAPAVDSSGNILPCCADPEKRFVLGNVKDTTIAEAWRSPKMERLRKDHLAGKYPGPCATCNVWREYKDMFF